MLSFRFFDENICDANFLQYFQKLFRILFSLDIYEQSWTK
jgi:hypothetical protein